MEIYVLAHKRTVGSGKRLADAVGGRCITPKNTKRLPKDSLLINFGVSDPCRTMIRHRGPVLNSSMAVGTAVNKLASLQAMTSRHVPTLTYTTLPSQAYSWFHHGDSKVFARKLLCSSQGEGIDVIEDPTVFLEGDTREYKLYTKNFPKHKEFRVHVFNGEVINVAQKRAMSPEKRASLGIEGEPDRAVRSYKNGWVFAQECTVDTTYVESAAVSAVKALGLDYGGVDVLARGKNEIASVAICEVNTAPSLSGVSTLEAYTEAVKSYVNNLGG